MTTLLYEAPKQLTTETHQRIATLILYLITLWYAIDQWMLRQEQVIHIFVHKVVSRFAILRVGVSFALAVVMAIIGSQEVTQWLMVNCLPLRVLVA